MQEINVEQIMEEIRAEIKAKGYKASDLNFEDEWDITSISKQKNETLNRLNDLLAQIESTKELHYYSEIKGFFIKRFIKRFTRKMVKFLIFPIVEEQNRFNNNVYNYCKEIIAVLSKKDFL